MAEHDEVYNEERAQRLAALLRALAERIQELDRSGQLLRGGPELLRLMGDARSELFHYEVRSTYDTPEVADSRRIVEERWLKVNNDSSGGMTLHDLAAVYGVSAERIRQIEVAAMKKMKKALADYA